MVSTGRSDDILSRWARRKEAVANEQAAETEAAGAAGAEPEAEPETEEEALALLAERDPELAEKIAALDVDTLTYEDDFTIFMSKKVPEIIRRRALAKLWLTDPVLANVDGLNEYDEDFRAAAELVKVIKSSWVPGRGYARVEDEEAGAEEIEESEGRETEISSADDGHAQTSDIVDDGESAVDEKQLEDTAKPQTS